MKKLLVIIVTVALLVGISAVTYGLGARADAMGGAFTAIADDGFAPYYNPAGMTQLKALAITGDIGISTYEDPNKIGLLGGVGVTTSSLAGNVFFGETVTSTDTEDTYDGTSYYVLSAATNLFSKSLSIGANFKLVNNYLQSVSYDGNEDLSWNGLAFSYDLGALFKPSNFVNIGIMGSNLNEPVLEMYDDYTGNYLEGCDVTIPSSVSVGIALKPSASTTLAADWEVINSVVEDEDSTAIIHLGLEQTALWDSIAIRLGMYADPMNIENTQHITVGGGLKIFGVYADMAIIGLNLEYPSVEFAGGFRW